MKKLVALIIAGMMSLTMVACGSSSSDTETTTAADSGVDAGSADTDTTEETSAE